MNSPPHHLLLVDKDPETRSMLRQHLGNAGYRINDLPDASAIEKWLAKHQTELVILDATPPDQDWSR